MSVSVRLSAAALKVIRLPSLGRDHVLVLTPVVRGLKSRVVRMFGLVESVC